MKNGAAVCFWRDMPNGRFPKEFVEELDRIFDLDNISFS